MKTSSKLFVYAGVAFAVASGAQAGTVTDPATGWSATWDASLDPYVDIQFHGTVEVNGRVGIVIQKSAEFIQPPPFPGLPFPTIPISFTPGHTATDLVIDDEIITNSTGVTWSGFRMELLDEGQVMFDPTRTTGGAGPIGFTIDPFTTAQFMQNNELLVLGGGTVADGETWFPGNGATDGVLWIQNNGASSFVLKETPLDGAIPLPTAAGMSVAGMLLLGVRRRR